MDRGERRHGVDFVVGPEDEPAPPSSPHRAPAGGIPRRMRLLLALVVLAAAILVTARLTSSPPRKSDQALPSVASIAALPRDPNDCRFGVACTTVRGAPDQVYAAIGAAFPGSTGHSATTVIADDGVHQPTLWFRAVQSGTEKLDISIRITQPRPSDRIVETRDPDGIGRVVTTVVTRAHEVQIEVVVTSNDASPPPSFTTMRRLAGDRRLVLLQ